MFSHKTIERGMRYSVVALLLASISVTAMTTAPAEAASCAAIGQQMAASQGGMLVRAAPVQGGRACNIVIVVPARNGERSRRIEMTVPAE